MKFNFLRHILCPRGSGETRMLNQRSELGHWVSKHQIRQIKVSTLLQLVFRWLEFCKLDSPFKGTVQGLCLSPPSPLLQLIFCNPFLPVLEVSQVTVTWVSSAAAATYQFYYSVAAEGHTEEVLVQHTHHHQPLSKVSWLIQVLHFPLH